MAYLLKIIRKRFANDTFFEGNICFIHHNPEHGNIGDYLCSPRHYFKFLTEIPITIIGGGVYKDFGKKKIKHYGLDIDKTILWGTGTSQLISDPSSAPIAPPEYSAWGLRDFDKVDTEHFIPCVSCLHPMLNTTISTDKTLLFLNADKKVTDPSTTEKINSLRKKRGWSILYNNCAQGLMAENIANHETIITNSFHGAYWGLLSGRKVILMGYSSKFTSLLKATEATSDQIIEIERGSGSSLLSALQSVNNNTTRIELSNASKKLREFRDINISFARKLISKGLIDAFELKLE